MSQENVEVVRGVRTPAAVSSKNRRRTLDERILVRFPALARLLLSAWARLPPRSRLHRAGVHRGHEGYLRVWKSVIEVMDDFKFEPEEVIDQGDRLFVAVRQTGRGTSSGIPVDQSIFQVFTLRRGLAIRLQDFVDRAEALEAVGLRE